MKFTNSSVYNKQHFFAVACIVIVLSVGVLLVAISNEPCNQGSSAKETLRRRLSSDTDLAENIFYTKMEQSAVQIKDNENGPAKEVEGDKQAQEANVKSTVTEYKQRTKILSNETLSYVALGAIPASWTILVNVVNRQLRTGLEERNPNPPDFAVAECLLGFFSTLLFMWASLSFLSRHGKHISVHFGAAGNGFIFLSQVCIFCSGTSLSCLVVSPNTTYAFGGFALGALYTCFLLRILSPGEASCRKYPNLHKAAYAGVAVLGVLATTGSTLLTFGANCTDPSLMENAGNVFIATGTLTVVWLLMKVAFWCGGDAKMQVQE